MEQIERELAAQAILLLPELLEQMKALTKEVQSVKADLLTLTRALKNKGIA